MFEEYVIPMICGFCFCVGLVIKNVFRNEKLNQTIPLIVGIIGIILVSWLHDWTLTPPILFSGLVSGLASTGIFETVRLFNYFKNRGEKDE